jgi:hypothetical protein
MNATTFRIYCEPKEGAQSGPHYVDEWLPSREAAEAYRQEMIEDGFGAYWKLSIRETELYELFDLTEEQPQ